MIFRVTFEFQDEIYQVLCNDIDLESHPYLVIIEGIEFEDQSSPIISPDGDKARKRFGDVEKISIPINALSLIEEIESKEKINQFKVVSK